MPPPISEWINARQPSHPASALDLLRTLGAVSPKGSRVTPLLFSWWGPAILYHFITNTIRFFEWMKHYWWTVTFWHCHTGKHLFAGSNSLAAMSSCCCLCAHSSCSFSTHCERGLGWALETVRYGPFTQDRRILRAPDIAVLSCCCAVGESLGFIAVDCVNQNEHQQIFSLLSWQLISTEPKRLSWRYICLGVQGCIADIRNLLILVVEDDAIVPRHCCCSGLKRKYLTCHAIALQKWEGLIISFRQSQQEILWGFF